MSEPLSLQAFIQSFILRDFSQTSVVLVGVGQQKRSLRLEKYLRKALVIMMMKVVLVLVVVLMVMVVLMVVVVVIRVVMVMEVVIMVMVLPH